MKKKVLLGVCIIIGCATYAQQGFDLGLSGTFMNTYIWRQNNYGTLAPYKEAGISQSELAYKPTWGGAGGIEAGYNFTKNWGVKLALQYCTTGQDYEDAFDGPVDLPQGTIGTPASRVDVKRTVRLGYVTIPVLAKFTTNKGHVAKFFATLGPQFGIRTAAYEQVVIAGYVYLPDSLNFPANQKFQSYDVGLNLQFGTDLYVTNHLYFEVGLSGYIGITDINGEVLQKLGWYDKNHVSYQQSHNTTAGLLVGAHYIFGRGRER